MFSISVKDNVATLQKGLRGWQMDILPLAVAKATTFAAEAAQAALKDEMRRVFDRPTDFTVNSVYITVATVANPVAKVWLRDDERKGVPPVRYLRPQIEGGSRVPKSSERQLRPMMGNNAYAIPADKAMLDGHGNLPGGTWMQILSQLRMQRDPKQNETEASRKRRRKRMAKGANINEFFTPRPGSGLRPGVYRRLAGGKAIGLVLGFAGAVNYKPIFDFYGVGVRAAREAFPAKLAASVERELRRSLGR